MSRTAFSIAGVIVLVAICASTAPAAGGELIRPERIGFKRAVYHAATGVLAPVDGGAQVRYGDVIWRSTEFSGYFFGAGNCGRPNEVDEMPFDWGDLPMLAWVDGFEIAYATGGGDDPNDVRLAIRFYDNSNGFGENEWPATAGFVLSLPGLPAGYTYEYIGWFITVDLDGSGLEFTLGDQDIDGDTLPDFGYSYHVVDYAHSAATGPIISGPNDPISGPGAEDAFDMYIREPGAGNPCDPNDPFVFDGTWWGSGSVYRQFHLAIYGGPACIPRDCSQSRCGCADFNNSGRVNLADLSQLLTAYGSYPGDSHYDAAVDTVCPFGVALEDLSALLSVYGLECE